MLMLAFVFQTLAVRKPDLDAGVYAYAKAGFGEYLGFFSAFGYWASACVGNVTYWVLIMSTVSVLFPELDSLWATATPSSRSACRRVGIWVFYLLIRRGVEEAAAINRIVTVAKLVPIIVFIILCLFVLDPSVFADNFSGTGELRLPVRPGEGHDARHRLRLPRRRGRERLLPPRQAPRGRRPGHRPRLPAACSASSRR